MYGSPAVLCNMKWQPWKGQGLLLIGMLEALSLLSFVDILSLQGFPRMLHLRPLLALSAGRTPGCGWKGELGQSKGTR